MKRFEGIYPAIITPIDEMEQINEKALAQVIERSVAQGVAGFYVSGSTGESFLLRDEQRAQLIRAVCEIVGGRRDVIAKAARRLSPRSRRFTSPIPSRRLYSIILILQRLPDFR